MNPSEDMVARFSIRCKSLYFLSKGVPVKNTVEMCMGEVMVAKAIYKSVETKKWEKKNITRESDWILVNKHLRVMLINEMLMLA